MYSMDEILTALQAIVDNPDDLSGLPNVITSLRELQTEQTTQETAYQERINSLQQANRNFLAQIPTTPNEPPAPPEDDKVTFKDAQQELLNAMKSVGGSY